MTTVTSRAGSHLTRLALLVTAVTLALSGVSLAMDMTYTTDEDFELGTKTNVNSDPPNSDQLQVNTTVSTFPVMWIANAGEDSVSRIDTDLDCETGRYETWFRGNHLGNAFSGPAPSRTAVDLDGNVYVANRHFDGKPPSVMKILLDGFVDRNGNGAVDTSVDANGDCMIDRDDPSELIRLVDGNGNGIVDQDELADERVAWIAQVGGNNELGRSLCIDTDGDLWLGTYNGRQYYELDSGDGSVISGPHGAGSLSFYGCLVDDDGMLYSANLGSNMGILDTNSPASFSTPSHSAFGNNYGIALGNDKVYLANQSSRSYTEYDIATGVFSTPAAVFDFTRGISVDGDGNIVLGQELIHKFAPDGSVIWSVPNPVGFSDQRGVIVDANNDVWVVNKNSNNVTKFSGVDGTHLATVPVGNQPYTYSDATGIAAVTAGGSGFWSVVQDGGAPGTEWDRIVWNTEPEGSEPPGTSITVEARSSDSEVDLPNQPFTPVTNGDPLSLVGRYIGVRATLETNGDGLSPVLSDLTITVVPDILVCDVDGDGDVDRIDIKMIFMMRDDQVTPGDPPDIDGDGVITVLDARKCVLECSLPICDEPPTGPRVGGPIVSQETGTAP